MEWFRITENRSGWVKAMVAFGLIGVLLAGRAQDSPSRPASVAKPTAESDAVAAELGIGSWIWTTHFADKQVCRFWRSFVIPAGQRVESAWLRLAVDNAYRLYVDGRELGQGGNWKTLSEYDLRWLLGPGRHVLAVEGLNDNLEAGLILGLHIHLANGEDLRILSDASWRIVPNNIHYWENRKEPGPDWASAQEVGVVGQPPWWLRPLSVISTPALRPIELRFWQTGWFLALVLAMCAAMAGWSLRLAAKLAVQTQAQNLLQQERARIARDIHDDLGAGLTQLTLHGELAQCELPAGSRTRAQIAGLCLRARALSDALDEVVWAVNPKRDSVQEFVSFMCSYAEAFFSKPEMRCRLEIDPQTANACLDLPTRRNLLLAVKEALRNAMEHSGGSEVFLRIQHHDGTLEVMVEDNGTGFDPSRTRGDRHGLSNMQERMRIVGGDCRIASMPQMGCRVVFTVPLGRAGRRPRGWLGWLGLGRRQVPAA